MKKLLLIIVTSIGIISTIYADTTSSMFQNAFNNKNTNSYNLDPNSYNINSPKRSLGDNHFLNKTVAIVNNYPVTSLELKKEVEKLQATIPPSQMHNMDEITIKRDALQALISQSILLQLANKNGIKVSDSQVNKAIQDVATRNGITIQSLQSSIESSGVSYKTYRDDFRNQLKINQLQQRSISQQVYVSPEEIKRYITKHKAEFDKEMEPTRIYTIKNLIVAVPDTDKRKRERLSLFNKLALATNDGDIEFSDMVKQYSQAPNASSGGVVNKTVKLSSIPKMYQKAAKELKESHTSVPFIRNKTIQMVYADKITEQAPYMNKKVTKYYVYAIAVNIDATTADKEAENMLDRATIALKSREKFSKVAQMYNQNYDHTDGKFGWVSELDSPPIVPPMAISKLEHMKPDILSEPFKADSNTWMILKYSKTKEYDAAKEIMDQKALEAIFSEKAAQIYKTWLASMKDDAYITILDKNLKTPEIY